MHSIGSKAALSILPAVLINPGDYVLMTTPGYPVFGTHAKYYGGLVHNLPLTAENRFLPDLDNIPADILKKSKVLVINYPNNPTGASATPEFFAEVVKFAQNNNIVVVHDAAYAALVFEGKPLSFLATPGAKEVGVEVFSLSKGYNMTGWRCAAITGNAEAIAQYWRLKTNVDSGNFEAVQLAGAAALAPEVDEEVRAMNAVYQRRRDLICDALGKIGVDVTPPKGTIYIWAPVPAGFKSAAAYCEHVLEEAAVVISPGGAYGPNGEGFFRISLTTPDDRLLEAVDRLGKLAE